MLESLQVPLSRYLFNSVFISVVSTALQILVASMAAYVLSKTQIRGRTVFFLIVQFSLLYNGTTLAVPQYLIFSKLGLIDTLLVYIRRLFRPLWAYFCASSISTRACRTRCLRRRASTARAMRIYWQIIMPIIKPAWMTLLLFAFQGIWAISPSSGTHLQRGA